MKEGNDILLVCLYVDDLIYMGSNLIMNDDFKSFMMKEFEMKDLGAEKCILGMDIRRDRNRSILYFS